MIVFNLCKYHSDLFFIRSNLLPKKIQADIDVLQPIRQEKLPNPLNIYFFVSILNNVFWRRAVKNIHAVNQFLCSLGRPYDIDFVHNTALDGTIYEGESVTFTCYAKGNPPITYYKLLHNGREIVRSASGKYVINEVKLKHDGTYCCIPINRASLGENRTVVLKVKGIH